MRPPPPPPSSPQISHFHGPPPWQLGKAEGKGHLLEQPAFAQAHPHVGGCHGTWAPQSLSHILQAWASLSLSDRILPTPPFIFSLTRKETYPCQAPRQGMAPGQEVAKGPAHRPWGDPGDSNRVAHAQLPGDLAHTSLLFQHPGSWACTQQPGLLALPKLLPRLWVPEGRKSSLEHPAISLARPGLSSCSPSKQPQEARSHGLPSALFFPPFKFKKREKQ